MLLLLGAVDLIKMHKYKYMEFAFVLGNYLPCRNGLLTHIFQSLNDC